MAIEYKPEQSKRDFYPNEDCYLKSRFGLVVVKVVQPAPNSQTWIINKGNVEKVANSLLLAKVRQEVK